MMLQCRRAGTESRGLWLFTAAMAACLAFSAPGARAQGVTGATGSTTNSTSTPAVAPSATTTSVDIQAANDQLSMEELAAQFYNANASKPYLAGVIAATPATGTPSTTVPSVGTTPATGINQPGINPSSDNGTLFAATLAGGGGNSAASATASFLLSKDQTMVSYSITFTALSGTPTAVRIRQGTSGSNTGIVLYTLNLPVNGVSSGQFEIRPEDVSTLMNGGMYLQVVTAQNPNGDLSGQIQLATGATAPGTPAVTVPAGSVFPANLNQDALKSMVDEIRAGHNAHVATLQQMLGTNAQPAVAFQNLDAPTLTQFLTMAKTFEDFAVSIAQNGIDSVLPSSASTTGTAPAAQNQPLMTTMVAILADDGRYAGAIRAFDKVIGTAAGGNPNITLSENGQPFNAPRTSAQLHTFLQSYLTAAGNTGTGTTTTPSTTAGGATSGGAAGTGTNPRPTTPAPTTPSGGAAGTGTNPRPPY